MPVVNKYVVKKTTINPAENVGIGTGQGKNRKYTDEDRAAALFSYFHHGQVQAAAIAIGVPRKTLEGWVNSEWGHKELARIRQLYSKELDSVYTRMIHDIATEAEDRIKKGNVVITKEGKKRRKPADLKELMIAGAIAYDKRALSRGDPTARTESVSTDKRLKGLSDAFRELADKDLAERLNRPGNEADKADKVH